MSYAIPVLLRYLSILVTFFTLIFVARRLSPTDVGIYYVVYGFVNTTYTISGFGLPDGLVKWVAHAVATGNSIHVRPLIRRSATVAACLAVPAIVMGVLVAIRLEPVRLVSLTALWWVFYGIAFFASQVLVALSKTSWGAFFYTPAGSIALFVTTVPYLVLARHPNINGTLAATAIGALIYAAWAVGCVAISWKELPHSTAEVSLRPVAKLGLHIGLARVLQSSLFWIPVWGIGLEHGAAAAGAMGTASRLNAAVGAVIAAFRFTIRPQIVGHAARGAWSSIANESRRLATVASVLTIAAMLAALAVGPWVIGLVFGAPYRSAGLLLVVLLFGTLGECVGGPADEVLKMTGKSGLVMVTLIVASASEAALVWPAARFGAYAIAAAQSLVFLSMNAFMLWGVWHFLRIYVGADLTPKSFKAILRKPEQIDPS